MKSKKDNRKKLLELINEAQDLYIESFDRPDDLPEVDLDEIIADHLIANDVAVVTRKKHVDCRVKGGVVRKSSEPKAFHVTYKMLVPPGRSFMCDNTLISNVDLLTAHGIGEIKRFLYMQHPYAFPGSIIILNVVPLHPDE